MTLSEEISAEDVDYMVRKVSEVVGRLRDMSPVWRDLQEGKREYVIR